MYLNGSKVKDLNLPESISGPRLSKRPLTNRQPQVAVDIAIINAAMPFSHISVAIRDRTTLGKFSKIPPRICLTDCTSPTSYS